MSELRQRRTEEEATNNLATDEAAELEELRRFKREVELQRAAAAAAANSGGAPAAINNAPPTATAALTNGKENALISEAQDPEKQKVIDEFLQMLQKTKQGPKPGLSNEAKKAKDALACDPYNMERIRDLGFAYATDDQWKQCANVLVRGWKRANTLKDPLERFEFLYLLCQASLQLEKYRQAMAVLQDIEDPPPETVDERVFSVLKCKVYSANGETQLALKAFHQAVDGQEFIHACAQWCACLEYMRKAGLVDVTKSTLLARATSDEDKAKLDAMEKIVDLKTQYKQEGQTSVAPAFKMIAGGFFVVSLCFIGYFLYQLEKHSLESMNMQI